MGCLALFKEKSIASSSFTKQKVVIVGLDGAGKTTILNRFKFDEARETVTTLGLNVETITHKNIEMLIFDIAGSGRPLWIHYLQNINILIWVIDSTDKERLPIIKEEMVKITQQMKDQSYLFALFLNKQDLDNKLPTHEILQKVGLDDLDVGDLFIQKCSALTGEGLSEGLDKIADYLSQQKKMKDNPMSVNKNNNQAVALD